MPGFSIKDFFAAIDSPTNGVVNLKGNGDTMTVNGKSFTLPKTSVPTPEQDLAFAKRIGAVADPAPRQDLSFAERIGAEAGSAPGTNVVKEAKAPAAYEEIEEKMYIPDDPIERHYKRRDQRMAERATRKFSYDMRFAKRRKRFNDALMHDLEGRDLSNPDERNYMYETWGATIDDNGNINIDEMPSPDVLKQIRR